jgi:hypothetical protein
MSHLDSQIDMLPSMLSLMAVEVRILVVDVDLLRDDIKQIPGRVTQHGISRKIL